MTHIVHKPFQFLCSVALILFCVLGASVAAMAAEKGSADQLPERCRMEAPATGVCKALFEVYSFNPETNVCEESTYGGCGGVVPFQTEEECKRVCETGDRLRLTGIAPEKELPYFVVTVEYPKKWEKPEFSVSVDGTPVSVRRLGGGYSGAAAVETFAVFSGQSGVKTIVVRTMINGTEHRVTKKHYVAAPEMAVLLDLTGDHEAVFSNDPIRFFLHQVTGPRVLVNGVAALLRSEVTERGTVVSIIPQWKSGLNGVILEGTGRTGKPIKKEYRFVYFPEVFAPAKASGPHQQAVHAPEVPLQLAVTERFTMQYGAPGSRSGPFYTVTSSGAALRVQEKNPLMMKIFVLDKDGWLAPVGTHVWEITGIEPGSGVLEFSVKKHFRGSYEREKTVAVTVSAKR